MLQVTAEPGHFGSIQNTRFVVQRWLTDVGPEDSATGQRSFTERNVSSRIAVRSGDSVVLGGLIRDNDAKSKSGVPLLMDIPVLGSLFSNTSNTLVRTELLIFITPKVVETDDELRALSTEMRDRMQGITDFSDVPIDLETSGER